MAGQARGSVKRSSRKLVEEECTQLLIRERAARAEAEAAERRFRDLVQGLDAIVWEANPVTWQFSFVSQRSEDILGYPAQQWLTEPDFWVNHIHPEDRERAVTYCQTATASGRDHAFEYRAIAADGRLVWLRDIVHVVKNGDGRPQLLYGVMVDVTERKQAEAALREYSERLQALSRRLLEIQEAERRQIARELHDEIGQALTGLKLAVDRAAAAGVETSLGEAQRLVNELMTRVRELALDLRPALLDDLGLLHALLWHFERYTRQTGVRVMFQHTGLGLRLPPDVETAAYRIVQEALTNVARHAQVREVAVRVWTDEATLGMQIEDQGIGFDAETALAAAISGGLLGMRERAILLGGHLTVEAAPGAGTSIVVELPLTGHLETGAQNR